MAGVPLSNASLKLLATVLVLAQAAQAITYSFPYGKQPVRGVNLGGWLLLEVSDFHSQVAEFKEN